MAFSKFSLKHWLLSSEVKAETDPPATPTPPPLLIEDVFAPPTDGLDVHVGPRNAMRCTAVRCAVQAIAETVGQLPVHLYRRTDNGGKERAPKHPAYRLLHDEVSDFVSAQEFREQLTRDTLLWGDGFALINRSGSYVELVRLPPDAVLVDEDDATLEPRYRVAFKNGSQRTYLPGDIFHLKAPSIDGLTGESPVSLARDAIRLALLLEQHGIALFKNGARPSAALGVALETTPEEIKKIHVAWRQTFGGARNHGFGVVPGLENLKTFSFTSVDAQFLEMRTFAIAEISRAFRVPPHMLFEMGRATWSNVAAVGQEFLTFTLMPWLKRWEAEARLKLLTADERKSYVVEFLVDDLLRADIASRADAYSKLIAARVISPNEARAMENRAPYDGGDKYENPNTSSPSSSEKSAPDGPSPNA